MEMRLGEIKEMNKYNKRGDYSIPPLFTGIKKEALYYSGTLRSIKKGDEVVILPQENCRTNADTVDNDDKIDGKKCRVVSVFSTLKQVQVEIIKPEDSLITFIVMASWLEPVKIKK